MINIAAAESETDKYTDEKQDHFGDSDVDSFEEQDS